MEVFRLEIPAALQGDANIPGLETHLVMYSRVLSGCTFGLDIQLFKPSLGLSGGYIMMSCDIIMAKVNSTVGDTNPYLG